MKSNRKNQKGFSLVELMVVLVVIAIIVAIAIPSLLKARVAASETAAIGNVRAINTAQVEFISTYPGIGYPTLLTALGGVADPCVPTSQAAAATLAPNAVTACLVDQQLSAASAAPGKGGYVYTLATNAATGGYALTATPTNTTQRYFYSDDTGVIRFAVGGPATAASTPIQ